MKKSDFLKELASMADSLTSGIYKSPTGQCHKVYMSNGKWMHGAPWSKAALASEKDNIIYADEPESLGLPNWSAHNWTFVGGLPRTSTQSEMPS